MNACVTLKFPLLPGGAALRALAAPLPRPDLPEGVARPVPLRYQWPLPKLFRTHATKGTPRPRDPSPFKGWRMACKPFRSQATPGLTQAEREQRRAALAVLAKAELMEQKRLDAIRYLGDEHVLHPNYKFDERHRLVLGVRE